MALTITPTESDVFTAIGDFIVAVTALDVNQSQENRVPEPLADDYSMMNLISWPRLGTNVVTYNGDQTKTIKQPSECVIQVDVHGSANFSNLLTTLFRDDFGVQFFDAYPDIAPLYVDDPRQTPFDNDQQQIENRWVIVFHLQVNLTVTTQQQSSTALAVDLIDVETPSTSWPNSTASTP